MWAISIDVSDIMQSHCVLTLVTHWSHGHTCHMSIFCINISFIKTHIELVITRFVSKQLLMKTDLGPGPGEVMT